MACGHHKFFIIISSKFPHFPFFNYLQFQIKIKTFPVMFEKAKSAKHVTIINFNKSFVQLRSETKAFQQKVKI